MNAEEHDAACHQDDDRDQASTRLMMTCAASSHHGGAGVVANRRSTPIWRLVTIGSGSWTSASMHRDRARHRRCASTNHLGRLRLRA